ncbi:hypothetical protein [Actinoplanes auranticolor]|uniref:Uncharacterized protein n=1 Tax=Actinoplanes auranticolor TaxID=47988 RepID=A0A919SR42_9ACTN|nr:hypothetical protein [Actinoplanes auranticolor]GIM77002.1 hypothetical protein Aau02nite_73730 [Actinoplanes auranticolor]
MGDVGAVGMVVAGVDATAVAVTLAASPREVVHTSDQVAEAIEKLVTRNQRLSELAQALVDGTEHKRA